MRGNKKYIVVAVLSALLVAVVLTFFLSGRNNTSGNKENHKVFVNYKTADSLAKKSNSSAAKFMSDQYYKANNEKDKSSYAMRAARYYYMVGDTKQGNYWIGLAESSFSKLHDTDGLSSAEQLKLHSAPSTGSNSSVKGAGSDTFQ